MTWKTFSLFFLHLHTKTHQITLNITECFNSKVICGSVFTDTEHHILSDPSLYKAIKSSQQQHTNIQNSFSKSISSFLNTSDLRYPAIAKKNRFQVNVYNLIYTRNTDQSASRSPDGQSCLWRTNIYTSYKRCRGVMMICTPGGGAAEENIKKETEIQA